MQTCYKISKSSKSGKKMFMCKRHKWWVDEGHAIFTLQLHNLPTKSDNTVNRVKTSFPAKGMIGMCFVLCQQYKCIR